MKVNDGGAINWQPGRNQSVRKEASNLPQESFVSGGNDWVPVKPNVTAAVNTKPSAVRNFTGAMTLALGLALTLGMTGCASVATAQSTQKTPIVQTQTRPAQDTSASYQIGKGLHEIGKGTKQAAQPVLDKGAEIGKEIGKTGAQVGREIGKAGKSFGKGVANEAKSFWKGVTGQE